MNVLPQILCNAAKSLSGLLAACIFTACGAGAGEYYGQFKDIPAEGWDYNDRMVFIPELEDSAATASVALVFRHTNGYLYSNIYVEVCVKDSLSESRDTFNVILADKFGRWLGHGIGTNYQRSDTVYPAITLHRPAMITLRHIMRQDKLPDIEQVGITINKL